MSQKPIDTDRPFSCKGFTLSPSNKQSPHQLRSPQKLRISLFSNKPNSQILNPPSHLREQPMPFKTHKRNCKTQDCKTHHTCKGLQSSPKLSNFCKVSAKLLNFFGQSLQRKYGNIYFGKRNGSAENSKCLTEMINCNTIVP